jgi:hypothetical protein
VFEFGVGDTYQINHENVHDIRGKASAYPCERCGEQAQDWATIHGQSGDGPDDFMSLCRMCHIRYDRSAGYACRKLSDDQAQQIKKLLAMDEFTDSEIGNAFGVTAAFISNIRRGKTYKDVV